MVHYDRILKVAVDIIEEIWKEEKKATAYIIQNVYGKLQVYVDVNDESLLSRIKEQLEKNIGHWLGSCGNLQENGFVKTEVELYIKSHSAIKDRIWIIEKYLTNVYWDQSVVRNKKLDLQSKLVCFYSYKGGVGRTTTMVMSAIEMAKRGKKIVMIDFDLEAPGVASIFPDESVSQYGILDYLIESGVYESDIQIDEYMYPVSDYCHVDQAGGEIYVIPAYGKVVDDDPKLYRKCLMRFNLDMPVYMERSTPIDGLLKKIDAFVKPDYIFIDTRSGLHQIGGITLSRYADMAVLFFYGSRQNVEGMKMVLPILKSNETPFVLINSKVPANDEVAAIERRIYLEGAYNALSICDTQYHEGDILIDDESGEHYPKEVPYNDSLEVVANMEQFKKAYEEQKSNYREIANVLEDTLSEEMEDRSVSVICDAGQDYIVDAFSEIMNGLETAAAEEEFSTEQSLCSNFYPLKGYTFIFDTRKFLILGQKGVGKTALFSALKNNNYAKALAKYLQVGIAQYEHTKWIVGTSQESDFSDIFRCLKNEEQISTFLLYEAIDVLIKSDSDLKRLAESSEVCWLFSKEIDIEQCKKLTDESAFYLSQLLRKMNQQLQEKNIVVTIIYDALDRIVPSKERSKLVSALIDMWYRYEGTVQNIRSKIFLRQDIYDREVVVADKVKLKNYSVTLGWAYDQLFAMVWKRVINKSEKIKNFFKEIAPRTLVEYDGLGSIPIIAEEENRKLLAALIGSTMGGTKKASTYNWFRNRLADTQGIIVPRSMLDIFAKAASKEAELRKPPVSTVSKSIIRPRCFEDSLELVSKNRVYDLKEEYKEYLNFLDDLKDTVQRSPVEEELLCTALEKSGLKNPKAEITNLINIGILRPYQRRLSDSIRYHFPDIYLKGLGLQRAGMR
ncbi:MAG: AAA family ATPase [Ruminococcus sp.]|nr:AAA family ATPase [Ruminococcus sp.]